MAGASQSDPESQSRSVGASGWLLACLGLPAAGAVLSILIAVALEVFFAPTALHVPAAMLVALLAACAAFGLLRHRGAGIPGALLGALCAFAATAVITVLTITAIFLAACGSNCFD
jgi:hypothetical protein